MAHKCLECNGCTDAVWILPRRFFHCAFCDIYYDIIADVMVKVDVVNEMNIHQEILDKIVEEKPNDRFS
jgi:hypothetical protein